MAIDEQLLSQLQGVDMSQLPMKMSTPQGFMSKFGDMVGGEPQISDAILNHLQTNMGLNVDAVAMDDLIPVVQEQVDRLAQQTEALLSKFRRTQSGLQQATDTLAGVGAADPSMAMGGGMPPPMAAGPPAAPPMDAAPPAGPPPPAEPPPPPDAAPPPEAPPPPPEPEEEGMAASDAGLKDVEGAVETAVEEGELSDEEYENIMQYIEVLHYLQQKYGNPEEPPMEEEAPLAEEPPMEDEGMMFDGENLSKLMAGMGR
jgi:hypothetical protein